jgi:mono/diheme cytochrome c family protein
MDFPVFHLDFFGNRFLIAFIAVIHVMINHSMAVGAAPLITLMEWWGYKTGDQRWDKLAYKIMFICFVITTSFGALTGVGIWLTTSLVNPYAIGSLIRVFFWAWFVEWVIFFLEVVFILVYYLTWKKMKDYKLLHIGIGVALSIFSWLTMAIIVAILGYMMDIGNWSGEKGILSGVMNPIYLPQLAFRTPWAMMSAGLFALFLTYFFTDRGSEIRLKATRFLSIWSLAWTPLMAIGAVWYWNVVPADLIPHLPVALLTQAYTTYSTQVYAVLLCLCGVQMVVCLWGVIKPNWLPRVALVLPFVLALVLFGSFERVREFIRKPYIIYNYMYANGIRVQDYPLLKDQGVLKYATYTSTPVITESNAIQAGKEVFRLTCTRCHTVTGVNSIVDKLNTLYGNGRWESEKVKLYLNGMHNALPFMPPFPGNEQELDAMTEYLLTLQRFQQAIPGAQSAGAMVPGKGLGAALPSDEM